MLAAAELGFTRVEGVELAENLCQIAEKNITSYKDATGLRTQIRIFEMNAAEYQVPDDSDFFFFNNPFGETIMQSAIDNILLSIDRKWREVVLLYINPEQRAVIDKTMAFDTIR